tara:strand:- start:91 stop:459 length:369 start_codon:yes stop_codon:yes gene_type:complete
VAHFAKIEEGLVTEVIVVNNSDITDGNGDEQESLGIDFINNTLGLSGTWKQTSYNTYGNQAQTYEDRNGLTPNTSTETAFRGNYAGVGFTYDSINDVFYAPDPSTEAQSYTLNTSTWLWEKD